MTNPSRFLSKGRAAVLGDSLRLLMAVRRMKPVMPSGWIMECEPPASIRSASPRRRSSNASPIAWVLAAHAVMQLYDGPRNPKACARCESATFGSCSCSFSGFMSRYDVSGQTRGSMERD